MIYRGNNTNKEKLEFSFTQDEGTMYRFTLKGQVGFKEAAVMERKLDHAISTGATRININMKQVSMFTSAAIRVILLAHKKLKKAGGGLKIECPSENVRNVIGMVALNELL